MRRTVVAILAATSTMATACGPTWPNRPVAVALSPTAPTASPIATVDVLPIDLQLWGEPGYQVDLATVGGAANAAIMNAAIAGLSSRHMQIAGLIDPSGTLDTGAAGMSRDELLATMDALGRYGDRAGEHPRTLPVPYLPARLGLATGADATLYVGGWGYVAAPHHSTTGDKILKGIAIGLIVIAAVAIVAAIADGGKSHGSSKAKSQSGTRDHRAAPREASDAVITGAVGGATVRDHRDGAGGGGLVWAPRDHRRPRRESSAAPIVDAFGRIAIDLAADSIEGTWSDEPALPRSGPSQMYLEMTLVDNHTGLAVWHAHQIFPARATTDEPARAARILLSSLPRT